RILDNQDKDETWVEMKEWVKEYAKTNKNLLGIGTGGNINKLYRMSDQKEGTPLTFAKLKTLQVYLSSFSLKDRINILGLNQDRADVILPASEIYLTLMKWANIKQMYVPRVGLVDGIIQLLIEKNTSKL
ncbi:MAG: exopolyphosphatase, partial [Daejeonella sp.]